ncbi:MAG: TetR/AcrR family transcriptional regulator [Deltaproteobacteria bacterium]|nr:TetR/AcrR family transcriptional regulator [Deltaproteobacteria bacterium]
MTTARRRGSARRAATPRAARRATRTMSRKAQGEETRRAILEAAVELYAESGFRGTALKAIGERAGVHHATVLYHYRTGRDLLVAVLQERDRRYLEFTRAVFQEGGLKPLENLPLMARFNQENHVWAKLFTVLQAENFDAGSELHDYYLERRNAGREMLTKALREAKQRGEVRGDVDAELTGDTIMAFAAGVQVFYLMDPTRVDPVALYERFTAMLLGDITRGARASSTRAPRATR